MAPISARVIAQRVGESDLISASDKWTTITRTFRVRDETGRDNMQINPRPEAIIRVGEIGPNQLGKRSRGVTI